jgi:HEAT repeat protein
LGNAGAQAAAVVPALAHALKDADPAVRSSAAHSLGELGSALAIPALLVAARDDVWAVRVRATLALSQLGEQGRAAVRSLRDDPDRYVADIAMLISGLGDGALLDMVEA